MTSFSSAAFPVLQRLPRRYEVTEVLAESPRSIIARVRDASLDRDVALKIHKRDMVGKEEALRFRREFGILASLSHPNIIRVFDFGVTDGGWPYFTMELVRGRTIRDAFDGTDWAGLTDLMLQVVSGLNHIHQAGMAHLDIKPSNILVDESQRARIMDFGLAIPHEQLQERRIRGTLHYMAPEVLRQDRIDFRADHYALGMTLYETVTGVHPAAGLPTHEMLALHLEGQIRRASLINPSIPEGIDRVISRLLERDPRHRYPSTTALLHEVARLAGLEQPREELVRERPDLLVAPLIGHHVATSALEAAIERARDGRGGGLLVTGEEGIGKSRTVREATLRAQLMGARVFYGRCPVNGRSVYAPFYEIFRQIVRTMNPEADPAREIRRIVRGAAPLIPGSAGEKFRFFNRVAQSIQDFYGFLNVVGSSGSPMILVIEDLQSADRATLELLMYLAGEAKSSFLLLIGIVSDTNREETADAAISVSGWVERASEGGMEIVRLGALTEGDVQELLTALLGAETLPLDLVRWITWESAGNPARVRSLVTLLIERQLLVWEDGEWRSNMSEIQQLRFPGGVAATWSERVDRLPLGDRTILQIASVFGEEFDIEEIAAVAAIPLDDVYATMQRMVHDELIASSESDGRFRFPQASAREAVYGSLPENTRVDLHCRAADLLEAAWNEGAIDRIGQLAYHCARGGDYNRAIEYALAAGDQAAAALVHEQAAEFYGTALELMDLAGEEDRKSAVREKLGDAYFQANHLRHASQVYQFLLKALEGSGDSPADAARLLRKVGRVHARRGDHESAIESFDRAASLFADLGDRPAWGELLSRRAASLQIVGRLDAAVAAANEAESLLKNEPESAVHGHLEQALGNLAAARNAREEAVSHFTRAADIAQRVGSPAIIRAARAALGELTWRMGRFEEALDHFRANLETAERAGDPWAIVQGCVDLARVEAEVGEWHTAVTLLERALEIDQRLALTEHEATAQMQLGIVLERIGRWKDARERLERSVALEGFDEARPARVAAYLPLARIHARTGDIATGARLARSAYETARRTHQEELGAEAALTMAEIEAAQDNFSDALRYVDEAILRFETRGVKPGCARALCFAADLSLRQHSIERARTLVQQTIDVTSVVPSAWIAASSDAVRARLLFLEGEREEAEALAAQLEARFKELEAPWEAGRFLLEIGMLREDPVAAAQSLTKAARIFEQLEASHELARVRGALARIRPGGRAQEPVIGLYEVVKIINSTLDLDEVLHRVLDLALRRLKAARGMIMLVDPITGELRTRAARNLTDEEAPRSPQTVIREVMRSGKSLLSADARQDERFDESHSVVAENVVSMLCVPLVIRDRISGAIYVDHQQASHLFTQADLNFLEAFADQAAIAIENARLYQELDESRARLTVENETLRREMLVEKHLDSIVGASDVVARIQFAIRKAAASPSTVLVRGESGTGKGLVARIIHNVSGRRNGPFINFNCAALPETLAESELFGHERGAFTGADRRKPGRFELANGGTLFLDEIGKVGVAVQAKLLRVVEEKEFERVGGTQTIRTDVKIIAATNLDLEKAIAEGTFREDLFYRLNIIPIHIPPLRERREDIPLLVEHFMKKICRDLGCDMRSLEPGVLDLFLQYDWPGNVRELEAVLHRAIVMSAGSRLGEHDFLTLIKTNGEVGASTLSPALIARTAANVTPELYEEAIGRLDRQLIQRALDESQGRIREAARRLGLARNTLKARMQKYGIAGRD